VTLHEMGGDVAQAAASFGGLVLVFLGGLVERFSARQTMDKAAGLARFRTRAWFATVAVLASVAATAFGLGAVASASDAAAIAALALLGLAGVVVVLATLVTAFEVR
jgi:sterol desaturase/sphingolipid hydroxylase (fatty acid hydroxylase superfamily)